ncbi:MAG: hypothetical protein COT84_03570 [Chlamydiae bacterium CG10_big_fil_rev_8_21_14_0_10_35_9]|nr:MAG: hypothetical protein COT84_03570 [Chlamydiae bacterium CG10_big_fil_rev_8_21_14_0_10_35_9]
MKRPRRYFSYFLILLTFYIGFGWVFYKSLNPSSPTLENPCIFYSNQCRDDLRWTLYKAIQNASESIDVIMFGLTEPSIIHVLSEKAKEIPVKMFYDAKNTPKLDRLLPHIDATPVKKSGFMHQKILIIDKKIVYVGSANFTKSSLLMHDNMIIGLYSPKIANFLLQKCPYSSGHLNVLHAGQELDFWLLPDPRGNGLNQALKILRRASKSIKIAIFTFTHPDVIQELIQAKKRGVDVTVVIDFGSSLGISQKTRQTLKQENIEVLVNQSNNLLHHKFICVDDKILLTGSANLTKAAFYKNHDCFLILHNLNEPQKKFITTLWKTIISQAK